MSEEKCDGGHEATESEKWYMTEYNRLVKENARLRQDAIEMNNKSAILGGMVANRDEMLKRLQAEKDALNKKLSATEQAFDGMRKTAETLKADKNALAEKINNANKFADIWKIGPESQQCPGCGRAVGFFTPLALCLEMERISEEKDALREIIAAMIPYYESCAIGNEHELVLKRAKSALENTTL